MDTAVHRVNLPFKAFDADNHYYEAEDAFIRHIDKRMQRRCMQWADINGRKKLLVGGKICPFIPNPSFDPVAKPGCMDQYYRANNPDDKDIKTLFGELEPIRVEYRDRDARLKVLDAQQVEATFMFPTLGVGMEQALKDDPEALVAAFKAFNRWLDEDWGCNYKERIFAAPYITLVDVDAAVEEVRWAVERDARVLVMRSAPVMLPAGNRSLGHPAHDSFWQAVADAGLTVAFHSGDSGYHHFADLWGQNNGAMKSFGATLLQSVLSPEPIADTVACLIVEGVLARHANLRIATIESGSEWITPLLRQLKKAYGQHPGAFAEDPADTLRRHFWVAPYYEDDMGALKAVIGADHILFGSDYPHAEGLEYPVNFIHDLEGFDGDEKQLIMRDNGLALAQRQLLA